MHWDYYLELSASNVDGKRIKSRSSKGDWIGNQGEMLCGIDGQQQKMEVDQISPQGAGMVSGSDDLVS